jgi:hypothetical protein
MAWACVLTLAAVGLLGGACTGAEFSSAGDPNSSGGTDASGGTPTEPNGGSPDSSGGSQSRAGEGGADTGSAGAAGAGGSSDLPLDCQPDDAPKCATKLSVASCDASGTWQVSDCESGPSDCSPATCSNGKCVTSSLVPADATGDCRHTSCANGEASDEVDLKDLPTPRGACDVASCTEAGPVLHADDSKCAVNKHCVEGKCACRPCPYGKLDNVVADACRMSLDGRVLAMANKVGAGFTAAGAVDGDMSKTWNSGTTDGTLTLVLDAPETMNALVIYVTGQADNNSMGARTISVNATVEVGSGAPLAKSGTWDFSMTPTGPIRLELGPVKASKITLKFSSPSSSIAVNEVLFVVCS